MKNVLIINQSAELYGADKALLELLENFPENYVPIVVLHEEGPLKIRLEKLGIKVIKSSVIKVKRGILTPMFFLKLPFETFYSIYKIKKELKGAKIDMVHSNAISVFIGAFYSFFLRKKHIWHVHEIIEHPRFLAKIYPKIVYFFSTKIIFNSKASFNQFEKIKKNISNKAEIVYNGQQRTYPVASADGVLKIRAEQFHVIQPKIMIGLVGRISRLKGQQLLLKAFNLLSKKYENIHLIYVGSPPEGQEHFLQKLIDKIERYNLKSKVTILDFQEIIWPIYDALDIVVVPSTEPESFGLVATEAMLSKKPVIGANIGGLMEIIVDGETGFLFEPKNALALANKLERLIIDSNKIKELGANGYERVIENFSSVSYVNGIKKVYESL